MTDLLPDTQTAIIAENVYFIRDILRNLLEISGCRVIAEAEDGIEAVSRYVEMRPGIIFLDVNIPMKSGVDVTREIVAKDRNAKVVICSTKAHHIHAAAAVEAGASAILFKPYNSRKITELLQKMALRKPAGLGMEETFLTPEAVDGG